ncbi:hypothetical protein NQZ68_005249 [Dissostichus eleginoides]|nr:hypothetical protein NQZ68_005249 [Dissostichus eleginoides]
MALSLYPASRETQREIHLTLFAPGASLGGLLSCTLAEEVDTKTRFQAPRLAMAQGSDSNDTSYKSPSPGSRPSSSDDVKKVMRREKNRIAAQKSRMRQTQKADNLHLESENLQKENAALKKEVKQLTEEAKYLSSVLSSHEPLCTGLAPQTPELLYPPHHSSYHHQHITVPHYQH